MQKMQQMQSMQKENVQDKPDVKVDQTLIENTVEEKSKWDVPKTEKSIQVEELKKPKTNKDEIVIKTDLFKVGWIFGFTIILLVSLTIINYQTTWLVSFSDAIARFSHIVK